MGKFDDLFKKRGANHRRIEIEILDSATGAPVVDALVNVESINSADVYGANTGANGVAVIGNFHKRVTTATIHVAHPDYVLFGTTRQMSTGTSFFISIQKKHVPAPTNEPWNEISEEAANNFKGNFGGFFIPGLPYHPTNLCYTPAYFLYDSHWRKVIRDETKRRGYTHMVVVIHNGQVYNKFYPRLEMTFEQKEQGLKELWLDGIIPVVTFYHDEEMHEISEDTRRLSYLIRVAFVKWEMDQPTGNVTLIMCQNIVNSLRTKRKDCSLYVHFGPKHSSGMGEGSFWYNPANPLEYSGEARAGWIFCESPSDTMNAAWWNWAWLCGIRGILAQGDPFFYFDISPEFCLTDAIDNANDFTKRFGTGHHGYPIGPHVVQFENTVMLSFHTCPGGAFEGEDIFTEEKNLEFSRRMRAHIYEGKQLHGFMNG